MESIGDIMSSEEEKVQKNQGSYTDLRKIRPSLEVHDLGREGVALHHVFGFDQIKKGNLHFINDNIIMYIASNAIVFENINGASKGYLLGIDEGGIGCLAVHPSRYYRLNSSS